MSVKFGDRMMQAHREKELSREERAEKIGTSGSIVDRYECVYMMPSISIATKIAEALEVSLDFLVGKSSLLVKDIICWSAWKALLNFILQKKNELFSVMDAYFRDYRTGKAYII